MSQRCPTIEKETNLGHIELMRLRQQYFLHFVHFFVSQAQEHYVACMWTQIFSPNVDLLILQVDYVDHKLALTLLKFGSKTHHFCNKF
uniref:Uncharacterized protein n=1 Tax=Lepeophtheirus salmonis TaxID=72036 RepID=A0A0K2V7V6_LEPSM